MLGAGEDCSPDARPLAGTRHAWTLAVDPAVAEEFSLRSSGSFSASLATIRPRWNSDIRWIGPKSVPAYRRFESAFNRLGMVERMRPFLDIDRAPRLYAGFVVARRTCKKPDFHVDWRGTDRQAFTLMTPVSGNSAGFGLIYRDDAGEIREYDYRPGEAILFSDDFLHSTRPGEAVEDVELLCFTFGTDKMKYWDSIRATSGSQSVVMSRPDGQFQRISGWRRLRRHLGWIAHRAGLR